MSRITAAEARQLAGPSVQERVDEVYPLIRKAATNKQREVGLFGQFWVNEGYDRTEAYVEACDLLRADGFTVEFFYEERAYVSMYTLVKW
jgi:hypothetical protein